LFKLHKKKQGKNQKLKKAKSKQTRQQKIKGEETTILNELLKYSYSWCIKTVF